MGAQHRVGKFSTLPEETATLPDGDLAVRRNRWRYRAGILRQMEPPCLANHAKPAVNLLPPGPTPDPAPVQFALLTPRALSVAIHRLQVLAVVNLFRKRGISLGAICRELKLNGPSVWRYELRFKQNGFAGLCPRKPPGRPKAKKL